MIDGVSEEDYILNHGYKAVLKQNFQTVFENLHDSRYTLVLFEAHIYLFFGETCLATSNDMAGVLYEYTDIPKDVLVRVSCGESSEIREKLYAYNLNKALEVLG